MHFYLRRDGVGFGTPLGRDPQKILRTNFATETGELHE
jgi:hypothetical protein